MEKISLKKMKVSESYIKEYISEYIKAGDKEESPDAIIYQDIKHILFVSFYFHYK